MNTDALLYIRNEADLPEAMIAADAVAEWDEDGGVSLSHAGDARPMLWFEPHATLTDKSEDGWSVKVGDLIRRLLEAPGTYLPVLPTERTPTAP